MSLIIELKNNIGKGTLFSVLCVSMIQPSNEIKNED